MMATRMPLSIGLGGHHKAEMPLESQVAGGSWLARRNWQQNKLTIVTPFAVPRHAMPDEVRSIVDAMAARLAANVALLTSSASWISATGYVTPAAIADVVWLSRDRHSHLTVTSPAVRSASRRKATTP